MATVTLRPNGGSVGTNWALTGGASIEAVTLDDSDASYVASNGVAGSVYPCSAAFGTTTLPALSRVVSVTPRYRFTHTVAPTQPYHKLYGSLGGEAAWVDQIVGTTSPTTYTGGSRASRPAGGAWTQADIDALTVNFNMKPNPGDAGWINTRVYELYLDVIYNEAPVTSAVLPTTSQATTRPTVSWTYTDPEGDAQERYRVKVFSAAQYGAGGFNPETSSPTWDSGEVLSAAGSVVVGTDLENSTTYRAYVKTADVGSGGRYSTWAFGGFSISITAPPTPTLTATADSPLARILLHAVVGSFGDPQRVIIERSLDAGATWATLRSADEVSPVATIVDAYDYEAPRGVAMLYRAKSVADSGGARVASAYTAEETATVDSTGWWLKDPLAPANNTQLEPLPGFAPRIKEPQTVYEPLGSDVSVVVSDGVRGIDGSLQLWSKTGARYARLEALVRSGHALFLEDVLGRSWYIKCGPSTEWSLVRALPAADETTPIRHFHQITIPFTEVASPTGVPAAGEPTLDPVVAPGGDYGYIGGY